MPLNSAFFAYPSEPPEIGWSVSGALKKRDELKPLPVINAWPKEQIIGIRLGEQIRDRIAAADLLIADITVSNFNVFYEIGFAIGRGKPIFLTINKGIENAMRNVVELGLFDTIMLQPYTNSIDLEKGLESLNDKPLLYEYSKDIDHQQPIFFLDSWAKTDFRNQIVSAIKASKVFYRSFDPSEQPRLTATDAIALVTASSGIIVPLLSSRSTDSYRHNLRAAFVAGLAHGLDRKALLIQLNEEPAPADYRDLIESARDPSAIAERVVEFSRESLVYAQELRRPRERQNRPKIAKLSLGASAAENEFRHLEEYFVQTFQFRRALQGQGKIVVGRKGSGKSAIFFQVRDRKRRDHRCFVVDLKPESHQLSYLRENISNLYDVGIFDHTISAFWQYIIYVEILLKLKDELFFLRRNPGILDLVHQIEQLLPTGQVDLSGDFTSRLTALTKALVFEIRSRAERGAKPTVQELTNIVFRIDLKALRQLAEKALVQGRGIFFLFDNIDKGWSARGVSSLDVRIVRLMIEALNKVERDFRRNSQNFEFLVFLRNDIYELMIDETPDRGKEGQILIDWSDREQLKKIIFERIQYYLDEGYSDFDEAWNQFFVKDIGGRASFDYLADRCLMRPRFLIDLIEKCVSIAVNRGHAVVTPDDIVQACRQHSYYLVSDFGYEIRDVSAVSQDIFYSFIGIGELVTHSDVVEVLKSANVAAEDTERMVDLLLWYGFLGIAFSDARKSYIYDVEYDFKRLKAQISAAKGDLLYCINPAFVDGLMH